MKALATNDMVFGPFASVQMLEDRWLCDNVEFQFSVIGEAAVTDWVAPPPPPKTREQLKAEREAAVAAIKVTTQAGNTFDGDEISQGRMARAIIALQGTGAASVTWVLADNSVIEATAAELTEALALAGAAQAAIWVV